MTSLAKKVPDPRPTAYPIVLPPYIKVLPGADRPPAPPSPPYIRHWDLHLLSWTSHSENLIKSPLIYSVSYLNLAGMRPPQPPW